MPDAITANMDPGGEINAAKIALFAVGAARASRALLLLSNAHRRSWSLPRWRVCARVAGAIGVAIAERRVRRTVQTLDATSALVAHGRHHVTGNMAAGGPWNWDAPPAIGEDQILHRVA